MKNKSPEEVLESAGPYFREVGDTAAQRDLQAQLAPATPNPTPGDSDLGSAHASKVSELKTSQRREVQTDKEELVGNNGVLGAQGRGKKVSLPSTEAQQRPRSRRIVLWLVVASITAFIGALAVAETVALAGPVGTILNLADTNTERYYIPGVLAFVAMILAHLYGYHAQMARSLRVPARSDAERRSALLNAGGVFLIGITAVFARSYAANLGDSSVDWESTAFFIGFQLVFVFGSLGLAHLLHLQLDAHNRAAMQAWLSRLSSTNETLTNRIEQASTRHAEQRLELDAALFEAWVGYRNRLAREHPDIHARVAWTTRNSGELAAPFTSGQQPGAEPPSDFPTGEESDPEPSGSTDQGTASDAGDRAGPVGPDEPDEEPTEVRTDTGNGSVPPQADPHPTGEPGAAGNRTGASEPTSESTQEPGNGTARRPQQRSSSDRSRYSDEDLFDAVLNPPEGRQ